MVEKYTWISLLKGVMVRFQVFFCELLISREFYGKAFSSRGILNILEKSSHKILERSRNFRQMLLIIFSDI